MTQRIQHTPGPWTISGEEHANVICGAHFVVADVFPEASDMTTGAGTHEEAEANARLIAAAPELLAVCLALQERGAVIATTGLGDQLTAAIAKAQGS